MKIAIFGNNYQHKFRNQLPDFFKLINDSGIETVVESTFLNYLKKNEPFFNDWEALEPDNLITGQTVVDYIFTLGGDGTLLHTAQLLREVDTPLLGINTGHLGFLTTATLGDAPLLVRQVLDGTLMIEERTMLQVTRAGETVSPQHALNEVAILRHDTSSMIEMKTLVNGIPLTTYKGDGLVVSTPSGSTAYNMSAGGPILAPTTASIALTPVSPHTLNMRPLVIPDNAVISITVSSRAKNFQVSVDGKSILCPNKSTLEIKKSKHHLKLAQLAGTSFADKLRNKLLWGRSS